MRQVRTVIKTALHYPSAMGWMWDYCIYLGPFVDSLGRKLDLGVCTSAAAILPGEASAAIVYGNDPGDYMSGDLKSFCFDHPNPQECYVETAKRAIDAGLIEAPDGWVAPTNFEEGRANNG